MESTLALVETARRRDGSPAQGEYEHLAYATRKIISLAHLQQELINEIEADNATIDRKHRRTRHATAILALMFVVTLTMLVVGSITPS